MHRTKSRFAATAFAVATVVLAGCGDDGGSPFNNGSDTTIAPANTDATDKTDVTETAVSEPLDTAAPDTADTAVRDTTAETIADDPGDGSAIDTSGAELDSALLTAAEVGEGFTASPADPDDNEPGPCDIPNKMEPVKRVGRQFNDADQTHSLEHKLSAYADADTAIEQFEAGREALAKCARKPITVGESTITIEKLDDELEGVDGSIIYRGKVESPSGNANVAIVAIRSGLYVTTLAFVGDASAPAGPNVVPIIEAAKEKLILLA